MMGRPRMPVVQGTSRARCAGRAKRPSPAQQLLLEVSRQRRLQFDGCLPECHRCLGLFHGHLHSPEMDKFELRSGKRRASPS